jgi:Mechanosensitive ion channel, transmembrane helices 2/3
VPQSAPVASAGNGRRVGSGRRVGHWALHEGTRIGGVLVVAVVTLWLSRRLVPRGISLAMGPSAAADATEADPAIIQAELKKRADTIAAVLVRTIDVVVIVLAALLVLSEAGFSVAPLLAGAGVAGLAIAFGAQSLVRDSVGAGRSITHARPAPPFSVASLSGPAPPTVWNGWHRRLTERHGRDVKSPDLRVFL